MTDRNDPIRIRPSPSQGRNVLPSIGEPATGVLTDWMGVTVKATGVDEAAFAAELGVNVTVEVGWMWM